MTSYVPPESERIRVSRDHAEHMRRLHGEQRGGMLGDPQQPLRQMTPEFFEAYQASMRWGLQNAVPTMTRRELKDASDAASARKRDEIIAFLIESGRA